jgi:hypothetical protein
MSNYEYYKNIICTQVLTFDTFCQCPFYLSVAKLYPFHNILAMSISSTIDTEPLSVFLKVTVKLFTLKNPNCWTHLLSIS